MRRWADITINIHFHKSGEKHKIELCRGLWGKWWVRFDRRNSRKLEQGTVTEVCASIRKLIVRRMQ